MIFFKSIKEQIVKISKINEKYLLKEFMTVLLSIIEFVTYSFLHYFYAYKYIKKNIKKNPSGPISATNATWTWILILIICILLLAYLGVRIYYLFFDKIDRGVELTLCLLIPFLLLWEFYYEYWYSREVIMIIFFFFVFNGAFVVFISTVYKPFFQSIGNILFNNKRDDTNTIKRLNFIYLLIGGIIAWIVKK